MIFENIIGNEKNKQILEQIVQNNNIAHSYMFIGQESIGKLIFAKKFAKSIMCKSQIKPCNTCKSCIEFDTNNNPDFNIIEPQGNVIKIDQIRELIKKVYEKPIVSNKKVYIINDSNLMTKEAQNSLLKTLEEPPEYVTIILIAQNENLFLPTIKSRCTKILFNKLTDENLLEILKKEYNYTNVPDITLKIAEGSVKRAIDLKDKEQMYTKTKEIFSNLETINILDIMAKKDEIFKDKDEITEILNYINLIFFDKVCSNARYINCMKTIEETKDRLKKNSNFDMTIDNFIMTVWEEVNG